MNRKIIVNELSVIRNELNDLSLAFERGDKSAMYSTLAGIKQAARYIEREMAKEKLVPKSVPTMEECIMMSIPGSYNYKGTK